LARQRLVTTDRRRRWLADLALAGITFIWGATFVVVKEALESCSTLLFLALRFSLAAVVLGLLFRRRLQRPSRAELGSGMAVGVALFLGYMFQTLGLRLTTPAKSAFITGLSVVLVPVLGALVYRSPPRWNAWAGVICGTVGLYWLVAPSGAWRMAAGEWLTLLCAASFGVHILLLGRLSRRGGVAALSVIQVGAAAALALASFWWAEEPWVRWTVPLIVAVVACGLLATALAFAVQTWAQQFTSPTHTALLFTLEPVFAWGTSYLVMGESLEGKALWGAGLILAGIIASEWK
jgi:drug/metabolite transporter (DMT)-like permease